MKVDLKNMVPCTTRWWRPCDGLQSI